MTGYGRAEKSINDKIFIIELKSLNGKQFDLRMMSPSILKQYEIDIRNLINAELERGSVECFINIKSNGSSKPIVLNTELLKAYYNSVSEIATELNTSTDNLLAAILKLPDVVTNNTESLTDDEWLQLQNLFKTALTNLNQHRLNEGASIEKDLLLRLDEIEKLEDQIKIIEPQRREKIREGFVKVLEENVGKENYDANRLEQELIYYIEKIDISEEQVRLKNHIQYFKELLKGSEKSKGKKLSFVLQEFGREINTTGSKANHAEIQKLVVQMKDELEKMKEQILNVL